MIEMDQEKDIVVPSKSDPNIDLLTPSGCDYCDLCQLELGNYSRVVTRSRRQNEGFSSYCISCFTLCHSPKSSLDEEDEIYDYCIIEPLCLQMSASGWTVLELCTLLECVQKYGSDCWSNVHREFITHASPWRTQVQLSEKYSSIYANMSDQFSYQRSPPQPIIHQQIDKKNIAKDLSFALSNIQSQDTEFGCEFYETLRIAGVMEPSSFTTDNNYDYLLKAFVQQKGKKNDSSNQQITEIDKKYQQELGWTMKFINKSYQFQKATTVAHQKLCKLYINMRKRQNRRKRQIIPKQRRIHYENISETPQLSKLTQIKQTAQFLAQMEELQNMRKILKGNLQAKKTNEANLQLEERKSKAKGRIERQLRSLN